MFQWGEIMDKNNYLLFNEALENKTNQLEGVNFIRYIGADDDKKCSVMCHYESDSQNGFYYGLHPQMTPDKLIDQVKTGMLRNRKSLLYFIRDNENLFSLHSNQENYKEAVFAMVLLRMASRFGVVIECEGEAAEGLIKHMDARKDLFIHNVTYKILDRDTDLKTAKIAFLGGLTDEAALYLDSGTFALAYDEGGRKIKLVSRNYRGACRFCQLYELLQDKKSADIFALCNGAVYYSGVLPRVRSVELIETYSNPDVQTLRLNVERTTFATLDAFDYSDIILHPLLRPYTEILNRFEQNEDAAQEGLFSPENYRNNRKMIEAVNAYLEKSYNTHTVAVSGNIITKDKALLVAKRHKGCIDDGTYYCSVNGQSEFRDPFVSFYKESMYADYPSLAADPDSRNDFGEELSREMAAELNMSGTSRSWEYYGLAILGIRNTDHLSANIRRMHFNVLACNSADENLQRVIALRSNALEKFESQCIEGIRMHIHYNVWDKIKTFGMNFLLFFREWDSVINYVLGFTFLVLTGSNWKSETGNGYGFAKFITTYLLAFFVILSGIMQIYKRIKIHKSVRPYLTVRNFTAGKSRMENVVNFSNTITENMNCHAILHLMLMLHLYSAFDSGAERQK